MKRPIWHDKYVKDPAWAMQQEAWHLAKRLREHCETFNLFGTFYEIEVKPKTTRKGKEL